MKGAVTVAVVVAVHLQVLASWPRPMLPTVQAGRSALTVRVVKAAVAPMEPPLPSADVRAPSDGGTRETVSDSAASGGAPKDAPLAPALEAELRLSHEVDEGPAAHSPPGRFAASAPMPASEPLLPVQEGPEHQDTAPGTSTVLPGAGPVQDEAFITTPPGPMPLAGTGTLHFAFQQGTAQGWATLAWHLADGRYSLTLQRQTPDRYWPEWHSEGEVLNDRGLVPHEHRVLRDGKVRERLLFGQSAPITGHARQLRIGRRQFTLPEGTQDRLSWWLQLPALAAAQPGLRAGQGIDIPVAHAQGAALWRFVLESRDARHWKFVREAPRAAGRPALRWTVHLDPMRGFLMTSLIFEADAQEQWALRLLESTERPSP